MTPEDPRNRELASDGESEGVEDQARVDPCEPRWWANDDHSCSVEVVKASAFDAALAELHQARAALLTALDTNQPSSLA